MVPELGIMEPLRGEISVMLVKLSIFRKQNYSESKGLVMHKMGKTGNAHGLNTSNPKYKEAYLNKAATTRLEVEDVKVP